jgi:hypothetical protein
VKSSVNRANLTPLCQEFWTRKERDRITIMVGIKQGELSLAAASPLLGLSYRQTQRI